LYQKPSEAPDESRLGRLFKRIVPAVLASLALTACTDAARIGGGDDSASALPPATKTDRKSVG
jgi:hypothetical protein